MDDLISRQAAIDAAINAADEWDGGCIPSRQDMIKKAINKLPSAQQWIPITQSLPTVYGNYLVTMRNNAVGYCLVDIAVFGIEDGMWSSCDADGFYFVGAKGFTVTAWMPLPEAFEEVKNDN